MYQYGLCRFIFSVGLAHFVRTLADDNVNNLRLFAIFGWIFSLGVSDKLIVQFVFHQVDGASAEATAHDTATCYAVFFGNVVQEVEFFAWYLILFAQARWL